MGLPGAALLLESRSRHLDATKSPFSSDFLSRVYLALLLLLFLIFSFVGPRRCDGVIWGVVLLCCVDIVVAERSERVMSRHDDDSNGDQRCWSGNDVGGRRMSERW